MNSLGLWMIWTTLGRELKAQNAMNNLGLWVTWTNLGHDVVSNSGLQWIDQGYMNSSGLWAPGFMTNQLEEECNT